MTKQTHVALMLCVAVAGTAVEARADCHYVRGSIAETRIPSNDQYGRLLGTVTGVLNGASTVFITSLSPVKSYDVFLTTAGDVLIATGLPVRTPVPGEPGEFITHVDLTVVGGSGKYAQATGTMTFDGRSHTTTVPPTADLIYKAPCAGRMSKAARTEPAAQAAYSLTVDDARVRGPYPGVPSGPPGAAPVSGASQPVIAPSKRDAPGTSRSGLGVEARSGSVGIGRMHDQLEPSATSESNGGEVTHVARREPKDAKRLGQRHHRSVDEAQTEIREASVHLHRPRELAEGRRRIREGAASEILHEGLRRLALVAKEVVDLREDETRHISGARLVDGLAKEGVVWRALDEIVDERPGIADERRCATGRRGTARARRRAPSPNAQSHVGCNKALQEAVLGEIGDVSNPVVSHGSPYSTGRR